MASLLAAQAAGRSRPGQPAGRAGAQREGSGRGRPIGARRGEPRGRARLDLVATLRAAAPWQPVRRREAGARAQSIHVRSDDFHVRRLRQRAGTTTVFVVDASGSAALHRLSEAKGAVEMLLADCYVRRDQVAVLAFRGKGAEILLAPTRSLARAKRSLAGLPGGGGTPLAAGLDAAAALAESIGRRGQTPVVVVLTDGRANIARDGSPGRGRAATDALASARQLAERCGTTLLIDTSPQPQPQAHALAEAMRARYLPLPHAGAAMVSAAVRAATAQP